MSADSNTPKGPKFTGAVTLPEQYGVQVGSLWVAIDFKAQAVAVTRTGRPTRSVKTEQLEAGVLIDRNANGDICCVELIG